MDKKFSPKDRRQQIVQGAYSALSEHGLAYLSYDQIAEASGTTRQLVRYHFPDHEALMVEVCDHLAGAYRDALVSLAGQLQGASRVDIFLDFYFDLLEGTAKPRDDQVYDAIMSKAAASVVLRDNLAGQYRLIGQVMSHEFSVQYSELDQQASDELSYLFVSLMYGHWKMVASLGYSEEHCRLARSAMDRLIRSYRDKGSHNPEMKVWSRGGM